MALRPICEPVELPFGASVIAEHVAIAEDAPALGRFMHFHDVAELVLFRRVCGEFIADGRRHRIGPGAVVFAPSMRQHDFRLDRGAMEWVLIQADPYLVESLAQRPGMARLGRPFCAWPDERASARIAMLADWLVDSAAKAGGAENERLLELILLAATAAPEAEGSAADELPRSFERLLPALEKLRSAPDKPISLEEAAAVCNLSPAYFSRRFRQVLGMTFTEYARIYRLHLAARRVATSAAPISEIAYSLGFSSPSHFSARFRERFDMSPRDYRKAARSRGREGS